MSSNDLWSLARFFNLSSNSVFSILIERRSYGFGIFYNIKNQGGGIQFRLKGFDFGGPSENFIDKIVHFTILLISKCMNFLGFGYARGGCQIIDKKYFNLIDGYNENYVAGEDIDYKASLESLRKSCAQIEELP